MLLTYSPSRCDAPLLRRLTVGRSREILIETLVDAVHAELGAGVHQHQLLIGPRGSGKTHVLAVVADRLESDPELGRRVLPVPLAEEEVAARPADLVIKIVERLESRLAGSDGVEGRSQALAACRDVHHRLRSEHDDDLALTLAAGTLEEIAEMLDRLLVPLVENLDQLFYAGYSRNKAIGAQWALRKILMESKGLMLVASAPSLFGDVADEGAPFYGFFRTHSLGELPPADMLALIRRRIEVELSHGDPDGATERRLQTLLANFERRSARLRGLLVMTGGLPRFAHLLFDLLTETDVASVAGMLDRFLDTQTPYFQSRLDPRIVPQAELEVLEALATADGPLLLSQITAEVRGGVTGNVSNYLKRLRQRGLVRQSGSRQEVRYDLTEPLFRVWRRFRIGPTERERIVTLAELVAAMFEPVELQAERRDLADHAEADFRRRVVEQALSDAGPISEVREPGAVYGNGDSEQRRTETEQLRNVLRSTEAHLVLSSISDNMFQRLAELARHSEQEGIRTGLIRFCVGALAAPPLLLEWLPLFEVELPASRLELLRPIRLAAEILTGRKKRELLDEPEEVRRAVTELLEKSQEKRSYGLTRADLASELLQALIERPTPVALDALWALRVELGQQDPGNALASIKVEEALAACAGRAND